MDSTQSEPTGVLLDPKRFAVHDGPGIRTTFFFKGCPLACLWCHNPESLSPKPQLAYYPHRCVNCGECVAVCPAKAHAMVDGKHQYDPARCAEHGACGACEEVCLGSALKLYGRRTTVAEALAVALEDVAFYRESGGGVTLSGGEPLMQPAFALALLAACQKAGLPTALDTCLMVPRAALEASLPLTDLYLVDFKHAEPEAHRRLTGQKNDAVLDNLRFLSDHGAAIEIRIPLVPGHNDDDANLEASGRILGGLKIGRVKVLPYHSLARTKYAALSMKDTMPQVADPTDDGLRRAVAILKGHGLDAFSARESARTEEKQ